MELILKGDVPNLGFKDDIVTVKNGYGRNFLIPKGLAILATDSARKVLIENLKQREFKEKKIMSAKKDIGDVENQWLTQYCRKKLETNNYNYFIFGHSHIPIEMELNSDSKYVNLGDWISHFSYAEFDGNELRLKTYEG